ncbi:MAG: SRPBCC domain-containing protein [Erythrobacter sp.]
MTGSLEPVVKTIALEVNVQRAFGHFTRRMADWWPLASHSLSGEDAKSVVFEARGGGRIYEVDGEGRERDWGHVLECEENARLVFSWVLEKPDLATEVEVRFTPKGDTACEVTLIHRGWDRRPDGAIWRANYNEGWDGVLDRYAASIPAS